VVFDGVHGAVGANDELFRVENAVASAVPVLAPMMTLRPENAGGPVAGLHIQASSFGSAILLL
jgi:hypothetical protein